MVPGLGWWAHLVLSAWKQAPEIHSSAQRQTGASLFQGNAFPVSVLPTSLVWAPRICPHVGEYIQFRVHVRVNSDEMPWAPIHDMTIPSSNNKCRLFSEVFYPCSQRSLISQISSAQLSKHRLKHVGIHKGAYCFSPAPYQSFRTF